MRTESVMGLMMGLALTATPANGQEFENLDVLNHRAAALAATLGQHAIAIDYRIKLPRCPELAVIEPLDRHAIAARCLPLGWRMRIALAPAEGPDRAVASSAAPVIKRGDPLRLRVQRDGFVLVYDVVAAANGRVGDMIFARAEGSKAMLQVKLLGPGQAMLAE
jgi:flagellar basal body P-ring formation protein FlgA